MLETNSLIDTKLPWLKPVLRRTEVNASDRSGAASSTLLPPHTDGETTTVRAAGPTPSSSPSSTLQPSALPRGPRLPHSFTHPRSQPKVTY
ncbi:hypothetical protein P171DRAFT_436123 [Karstenula rhodostoma CBS 690.94]|uniref:Uncharacterized protein n=1 Tax=Karstenula rhodostoma CBS 690.94 TaxID=1392251 RepID=A0A9P4PAJ2_9PLEO|nr:hypothetical protein P171DRAFT_436123 [Karstenula rhodostoma CBS 690.94]